MKFIGNLLTVRTTNQSTNRIELLHHIHIVRNIRSINTTGISDQATAKHLRINRCSLIHLQLEHPCKKQQRSQRNLWLTMQNEAIALSAQLGARWSGSGSRFGRTGDTHGYASSSLPGRSLFPSLGSVLLHHRGGIGGFPTCLHRYIHSPDSRQLTR